MGKIKLSSFLVFFVWLGFFSSCERKNIVNESYQHPIDTVSVATDPSFAPVLRQLQAVFEANHHHRRLQLHNLTERNAIEHLISGKVKTILIGRSLSTLELNRLKAANYQPRSYAIARDALAILLSPGNADTLYTLADFEQSLSKGKWKVLVDSSGSSTAELFFAFFPKAPRDKVFKAGNLDSLCASLAKSSNGYLGLLSSGHLAGSDKKDRVAHLLERFPVLGFRCFDSLGVEKKYFPFQADLEPKRYPLIRDWHVVTVENPNSSGTGFVNYLLSEPAQRVILSAGFLPARFPEMQIELIEKQ